MARCIDCERTFNKPTDKSYLVRCYGCYVKWKEYCDAYDPRADYVAGKIYQDFGISKRIKSLIQLCHPDKHSDSKLANEITQWLNSLPRRS